MTGELSPEGLRYLLTRTRPDLCPVRVRSDGAGERDCKPAARRWLADRIGVNPNTVDGWISRGETFPPAQQDACLRACAEHALINRRPVEPRQALAGLRGLIVEDEAILALDLQRVLIDLGCALPEIALDLRQTRAAADADSWDFALVDLSLRGVLAWPAVARLAADQVPTVLMTAYDSRSASEPPGIVPAPPRLIKPIDEDQLVGVLLAVVG